MSSYSNYLNRLNGTNKKKKKEEEEAYTQYMQSFAKKNTDIAPIKTTTTVAPTVKPTTTKKDDRTWFQKGAFADGYDFGDITKTILGSVADIGENIGAGIMGMGEKTVDALAMIGSAMNRSTMQQAAQNELQFNALTGKKTDHVLKSYDTYQKQVEKETADFVKKDWYNEEQIAKKIITAPVKNLTGIDAETDSVFGEKSDALVQSGGQLLATAGLQAMGVPWFLTTGATSFGAEAENALNEGATFEQASMSATISAGAEILSEKLSGGIKFGGKTLDDVLVKPFVEKISGKVAKSLVNLGIDAVGEGAEEIVSSVFSNLGTALYKEESIGELLTSEEAVDEYIESFLGGAFLGGFSSGISSIANRNKTTLSENELDADEKMVFDKVVEDLIAEAKESGKNVDAKAEAEIRKAVLKELAEGGIDTDTIESVLDAEGYDAYKKASDSHDESITQGKELLELQKKVLESLDNENAALDELDLTQAKLGDFNRQNDIKSKRAEVESRIKQTEDILKGLEADTKVSDMKTQLGQNVFERVKGNRLKESYNEVSRRKEAFTADLSKYDKKQQAVIQKAIDSGILNNTNKTHKFVDFIAKVSADKGVSFDFTNNEKIKDSGFAVEGKTVNGYKTDDGNIAINIQSSKALETVVGHEITHILEGTELYTELQNAIKEYATTKGEYVSRMQSLRKMYEGVYEGKDFDDKIRQELTADIVGEYLFTDADFVNRLSTEHRNIFQKFYDEIKYLCKIATAGSKEAKELERVKRSFEKAYRESVKVEGKTQYLLDHVDNIGKILYDKKNPLSIVNRAKTVNNSSLKWVYDAEIFSYRESELFHGAISKINTGKHSFGKNINTLGEYMIPIDNKIVFTDGNYDSPYVREIIEVVTDCEDEFQKIRERIFNVEKGKSTKQDEVRIINQMFGAGCIISYNSRNNGVYDWQNGKRKGKTRRTVIRNHLNKQIRAGNDRASREAQINEIAPVKETSSEDGVFFDAEKTKYSLSEDSVGRELSEEQQNYFKNSKAVDEKGSLKLVYHGTRNADFSVFKRNATYFTDSKEMADSYSPNGEMFEGYVNITKPYEIDAKGEKWSRIPIDDDTVDFLKEYGASVFKEGGKWRTTPADIVSAIEEAVEDGAMDYDGIIIKNIDDTGSYYKDKDKHLATDYIVFNSNQFKNADNKKPTSNLDIRFSLSEDEDVENDLLSRSAKSFGITKPGDYVQVQRQVFDTLEKEGFFNDEGSRSRTVTNSDSSMQVEINKKGIKETFNHGNYGKFSREYRGLKLATVRMLPQIIENGKLISDNVGNYHNADSSVKFAYIEADVQVDGRSMSVKIDIKKSPQKNKFWVHSIDIKEKVDEVPSDTSRVLKRGYSLTNSTKSISHTERNVNSDDKAPVKNNKISLSEEGEVPSKYGRFFGKDLMYRGEDIAPVQSTPSVVEKTVSETEKVAPTRELVNEDDYAPMSEEDAVAMLDRGYIDSLTDADMPPEIEAPIYSPDTLSVNEKSLKNISAMARDILYLTPKERRTLEDVIQKHSTSETQSKEDLFNEIKKLFGEKSYTERIEEIANIRNVLRGYKINVSPFIKRDIADYTQFMRRNFGKITFSNEGLPVDTAYMELSAEYPEYFPSDIVNATDQLLQMSAVANMERDVTHTYELEDDVIQEATDVIEEALGSYNEKQLLRATEKDSRAILRDEIKGEKEAQKGLTRAKLHNSIIERIKTKFAEKGFDFDEVLNNAKNLATFRTVDNTPQRVMEKALGYKQGQALADETVNKVAQNESEGIKWLNSFTDRKKGLLAQISNQYNIKPGSKKSAAAQMYAEGFYVNENNEIIEYGDRELAIDFPNARDQANIKGLARDPRIRQIYDETLEAINESRRRNVYPEIPRLDNYFLHFRAMEDTFSRLGLPFNPNDIRAKDLPTDLNGVTADLKPGQPYFASAKHREGMRTSFDLLGGLERYLTSAKNQIYHIDDIQTLRALRNYIADTYGQAKGLESLDGLTEEEAQERIEQVYGSHLSTFAKFLNEEANVLAGKTALIDRGFEGIFGRRGITFLNTFNAQVGSNMVGFNVSSSLTNILPVVQTMAKTNKFDLVKALAQTTADKINSLHGKSDGFRESSPVIIRRKGAERFYRTPFQKIGDTGYILMSAVDDISTELIARTKYNELTRKGMDSQQAHFETDKWVSRLMGDRSLGQQPQIFNSKMLGLVTKFQLEVRNQLDSQFYDTIQEAKVSNEEIENKLLRNAKTAAKVGSTFFQLAALQHIFGAAFESVAGYNPAFDIVEVLIKTLGIDDDEEDEDTVLDNIEEGFFALLEDLPYTSTLTGGRIPISSGLPITEFIKGVDQYGNEKSRWDTIKEAAPYYVLPTGYGQYKKTKQGLGMFSDEHLVSGSYTDSGNLRFPVEDNLKNRIQAGIFGQYANENARTYFDEDYAPLKEKQIKEYAEADMPIADYWKYREGLKDFDKQAEKAAYINGLDISKKQKDVLKSYLYDEEGYKKENPEKYAFLEKEGIGYLGYKELDEDTQSAWSWAFKHQDEYEHYKENGVLPGDYSTYYIPMLDFKNEDDKAYQWAFDYPEKATLGRVFNEGVKEYRQYSAALDDIRADKDRNGKSISGSAKAKKKAYIWSLPLDYGQKVILYRSLYDSNADKAEYNQDIIDYLNSRDDITYDEMNTICEELGFKVNRATGSISW